MLKSLYIKNIAVIEELEVTFEPGLNVITGPTGSGKTILIQALKYILGERFSKDMLRTGTEKAVISAEFYTEDRTTEIKRIFSASGSSRTYINDEPGSVEMLKDKSRALADIHGQHEQQRLLDPDQHLYYLDAYGDYGSLLTEINRIYREWRDTNREIVQLEKVNKDIKEKLELYRFQLHELDLIPLAPDLDNTLESEYRKLANAAEIRTRIQQALHFLDGSGESAHTSIQMAIQNVDHSSRYDDQLSTLARRLEGYRIDLDDLIQELHTYLRGVNIDTERMEVLADQIAHLESLKRNYGGSLPAVLNYRMKIRDILNNRTEDDNRLEYLHGRRKGLQQEYEKMASILTAKRRQAGELFASAVMTILKRMDMENTVFSIRYTELQESMPTSSGKDQVEFLISPNIGEQVRPLTKVASGGELSRIMLAIKIIMQNHDLTDTLIFDEVDAGISGSTAERIGYLMEELAQYHQVICITHIAQIACRGKSHYRIAKHQRDERTFTSIDPLNARDRIDAIAELISGLQITSHSRKQAQELITGPHG